MKKVLLFLCAVSIALSFSGCKEKTEATGGTLTYYLPLNAQDANEQVLGEATKTIKEKLGIDMKFFAVDFANYDQKMTLVNASREQYDLCYTSNWANDYQTNIANGNIIPLDELLSAHASGLKEKIGERYWDGVRVNGKIYGIINRQIMARESGWIIPEKFAEATEMDLKTELMTLDGIEKFITSVQAKYPEATKVWSLNSAYCTLNGLEFVLNESVPVVIYANREGKPEVFNLYKSKEMKDYIAARKSWVSKGIVPEVMNADNEALSAIYYKNGKLATPIYSLNTYSPGIETTILSQNNVDTVVVPLGGARISQAAVTSTMQSISSTSKNQEMAMKYIDFVNSDKEFYNLMSFGIEGENYTKVDENRIKLNEAKPYIAPSWAYGDTFQSYIVGEQEQDIYAETNALNEKARLSPLFGFTPDISALSVQIANCTSVNTEYFNTMSWCVGNVDVQYDEMMTKFDAGGIEEIIAEIQRQIDKWYVEK